MKVNQYLVPIFLIAALLGAVGIAQLTGGWTTSGRDAVLTDAAGNPDPAGIKGWMTLEMVSETYGIPLAELYARVGIPAEVSPETELKSLERLVPNWGGMDQLRTAVADYLAGEAGLPPPPTVPETAVPAPADTPTAVATDAPGTGDGSGAGRPTSTPLPAGQVLSAAEIKARMTLREVADLCGVPLDYLYQQLNIPAGENPNQALKDARDRYGFEIETVRAVVQEYQDAHQ